MERRDGDPSEEFGLPSEAAPSASSPQRAAEELGPPARPAVHRGDYEQRRRRRMRPIR